jgi:lipopolysaccharide biosynthesis protein
MKALCFYLPQYHPIPENDSWWGKGFTEWTNVARAAPLFRGHTQPHIPADLGFYDLRLPEARAAQAELAAEYGLGGFCYYHYWFNGRMLLERPFNEVLSSGEPDFPFCLCWANGNWTRRWDGRERDVLMAQDYAGYIPGEHYRWLSAAFADPRYVTVHARPLFLVYDAASIPQLERVVEAWRLNAVQEGMPDPYLCGVLSPGNTMTYDSFWKAGFDAVTEFYPTGRRPLEGAFDSAAGRAGVALLRRIRARLRQEGIEPGGPTIHNYRALVASAIGSYESAPGKLFPCVMPGWDNSPRRGRGATIIQNDDPDLYGEWLRKAADRLGDHDPEEQIVFINAWNEWGEGCHLEPDLRHGRRFLEATRAALTAVSEPSDSSGAAADERSAEVGIAGSLPS